MRAPSAPLRRGTSPKYDSKITLANLNLHVGFGGGKCESAVEVGLVRAGRLYPLGFGLEKIVV